MTNIVFLGSPVFAVPSLQALAKTFNVTGVVTQPDRPAGRGKKLKPSPVKAAALELDIPVITPLNLRKEPDAIAQIKAWQPDILVVVAFGQILSEDVLYLAPHNTINIHFSLLPRHRGAAPIAGAILAGDAEVGVTIMEVVYKLDAGAIITQRSMPLLPHHTTNNLTQVMSDLGAALLVDTIPDYIAGKITPTPQDDAKMTYIGKISKADGKIDWNETAALIDRKIRAYDPWPGTFTEWNGQPLKIKQAKPIALDIPVGHVQAHEKHPCVGTAQGALMLLSVQPPGKKAMAAADFLRGNPNFLQSTLS